MRIVDTDEQMNIEIERLKNSPHVALARKELRLKYKKTSIFIQFA